MKIVTVIQARTGSTRLPNKIMLSVLGRPLLLHMLDRVRRAKLTGRIVVATTTESADDALCALCNESGIPYYRGHPTDLLDRHCMVGRLHKADVVVKIPSDCPLIDPAVVDEVIGFYTDHSAHYDFVSNLHPASYPDGNDVEVIPMRTLTTAWKESRKDFEREHTTPFIWEHPERFRLGNVRWGTGLDYSMTHRWTLDYPADFEFIRTVYEHLYPDNAHFCLGDILRLLERRPDIAAINSGLIGINWYRHHMNELRTIEPSQTRPDRLQGAS